GRRPSFNNSRPGRPARSGSGGGFGYGRRPQRGPQQSRRILSPGQQYIDESRFVNKNVAVAEQVAFVPQNRFADFALDQKLKTNIEKRGYETPTAVQDAAIPHGLLGRDIVGIADTGSGKTGAFLIPLINKVLHNRNERILIMAPTRELAQQIEEEFWGFAEYMRIGAVSCVGGANINRQIATLRRRPNFVIGTPGRLKDLVERRALDLGSFNTIVLDEADRMLDMGFIGDMRSILARMSDNRHTLFFSATLSPEIKKLIGEFLREPISVSVKTGDTAQTVDQDVVRVGGRQRLDVLHDLLVKPEFDKVIIFGRTKHGVEKLSKALQQRGFKAASIHGNKTQTHRQKALGAFKQNQVSILVATDVAARGLDIPKVSHVINYDIPNTYEDYVHRIGRTGRAGEPGIALTFVE
ncbi:MAG TPA: DEAD/DEAH box helicase, partial [Candidatus Paceibacterota bacterium]